MVTIKTPSVSHEDSSAHMKQKSAPSTPSRYETENNILAARSQPALEMTGFWMLRCIVYGKEHWIGSQEVYFCPGSILC